MTLSAASVRGPNGEAGGVAADPYIRQMGVLGTVVGIGAFLAYTSVKIPLVCPLRLMTGVPCPMCGMTTGTTALMRGDFGSAAAANPFSLVLVPGIVGLMIDRAIRSVRRLPDIKVGPRLRRRLLIVSAVVLTASWVFQLLRFQTFG